MSTAHTPLPWRVGHDCDGVVTIYADDAVHIVASGMSEEDADYVVAACNSHTAMLESIKLVVAAIERCMEIGGEHSPELYLDELKSAIASIERGDK